MTSPVPSAVGVHGFFRRHARAIDRATAAALLVVCAAPYLLAAAGPEASTSDVQRQLSFVAVTAALVIPLAWRRTHPTHSAMAIVIACALQVVFGISLVFGQVAVLVAVFGLAARAPRRASFLGLTLGLAGMPIAIARFVWESGNPAQSLKSSLFTLVVGWLCVAVSWLAGEVARSRRVERDRLAEHARRLERERVAAEALAVTEERARIAREMHDIIAHSLSVIVAQADGARYSVPDGAAHLVGPLDAIADAAREALADTRRLLGALRSDETAAAEPSPGLRDIATLISTFDRAGLPTEFVENYDGDLAAGAELVAYRVIQEALTNALKHGGPDARARVILSTSDGALSITVEDTGSGISADVTASRAGGNGLLGMRERVALYEGTMSIGRGENGGSVVRVDIPLEVRS